jgi:endonuclease III
VNRQSIVRDLLIRYGETYASEAGVTLRDKPAPLYQLLVYATLASARIRADIAAAAAHEVFRSGMRTPERMREASWQQRVDALGRGGYRRYDERTSTMLGEGARRVLEEYGGDLRRIRPDRRADVPKIQRILLGFPGIGPTGAAIYCREVQGVWPAVAPFFDDRSRQAADELGLPSDSDELAELVPASQLPVLAAALVRIG